MMPRDIDAPAKPRNGFTLVEMLMTITISSLVVGAALSLFDSFMKNERATSIRTEVHQNARYAVDMLTREILEAGEGLDPTAKFAVVSTADGSSGAPDTLFIVRSDAGTAVHQVLEPTGDPLKEILLNLTCADSVLDVRAGTLLHLARGPTRGLAIVNSVTRNETGVSCPPVDPDADIGHVVLGVTAAARPHGWKLRANKDGAAAHRVNVAVYFINTDGPTPVLVRATRQESGKWVGPPIAEGIVDFQTDLVFGDGGVAPEASSKDTDATNDYDDIFTVRAYLKARAWRTDRNLAGGGVYEREYSVRATPRNPLYSRNLE
jgi:prepilin-type N-terminal cleavage/methylation domain-containing protein